MGAREELLAITPIDGRYAEKTRPLVDICSEYGLIKRRVNVEVAWLRTIASGVLPDVTPLSPAAADKLTALAADFDVDAALAVKAIEATTNHDVKAVEMWLGEQLRDDPELSEYVELIHFGCTSEDINNLAYAMMIRDARDGVIIPDIQAVIDDLGVKAIDLADVPMLARTHGQPATPTTLGKEMKVFEARLSGSLKRLGQLAIYGKFNGASGGYNADTVAYPEVDWPTVCREFVESLGFEFNHATTQIEPHDWMGSFFNELGLNSQIMMDLAQDMWGYISLRYFRQQVVAGEVGSSTMPHKVNPIDFENAESNLGTGAAQLASLASRLAMSRWQRDLRDSSTLRTVGEAFGHIRVGHRSLLRGLGKVQADTERIADDLNSDWAILTEAVQTVMRRYGVTGAYNIIKQASRGRTMSQDDYLAMVAALGEAGLPEAAVSELLELTPATYIGRSADIARGQI